MFDKRFLVCLTAVVALATSSSSMNVEAQRLRGPSAERSLVMQADASQFYTAMLQRVNAERAKLGKGKLCYNSKLQKAAQLHSEDQASHNSMSHTGSDGSTLETRAKRVQFKWDGIGENVAAGQVNVDAVMTSWMNSDGHRANILGDYTHFGMGYAYTTQGVYHSFWTQDFGLGSTEACDGTGQNENAVIPAPAAPVAPVPKKDVVVAPTPAPQPAKTPAPTAAPTPAATKPESPKQGPVPVQTPKKKKRDCHAN